VAVTSLIACSRGTRSWFSARPVTTPSDGLVAVTSRPAAASSRATSVMRRSEASRRTKTTRSIILTRPRYATPASPCPRQPSCRSVNAGSPQQLGRLLQRPGLRFDPGRPVGPGEPRRGVDVVDLADEAVGQLVGRDPDVPAGQLLSAPLTLVGASDPVRVHRKLSRRSITQRL